MTTTNHDDLIETAHRLEDLPYAKDLVTCLPHTESELRQRITLAVGAASSCWENLAGAGVFDSERAKAVAEDLTKHVLRLTRLGEPSLGCATTRQLLEDLTARVEMGHPEGLDYRTVGES